MKSIRSKLIVYFFVFVVLFNIVSVSIYVSSKTLTNEYHSNFDRFLIFNSISQTTNQLADNTRAFAMDQSEENRRSYYQSLNQLKHERDRFINSLTPEEQGQSKNYLNLIENMIYESEVAFGFVLRDEIERYTAHLGETQNNAAYIQDTTLQFIDLELTEYQSFYADLTRRNEAFQWFILFVFTTTVMLAVFFAFWFSRGISRPIQSLTSAAKEVSKGNFHGEPVNIQSKDELSVLASSFNQMQADIHGLIEEIKDKSEQERLMKELELKHLQNQVNPHFLFNTLNTVSKMAYLEGAKSTSNLIDSVASLLRYSLGDIERFVTLRDEVRVVEDYLSIQKTRFMERIDFKIKVEEECLDIPVPRLTLQPIVENAFIHGVEGKEEGGLIELYVYRKNTAIFVEIKDNGVGMTEDKIAGIFSFDDQTKEEHVGHSTGLGMKNVMRRLQLFYRKEQVIEIDSTLYKGTTIKLVLPVEDAFQEEKRIETENNFSYPHLITGRGEA